MSFNIPDELMPLLTGILNDCNKNLEALLGNKMLVRLVLTKRVNAEILQELVVDGFNVAWIEVRTNSRKAEVVAARQAYAYLNHLFLPRRCAKDVMADVNRDRTTFYKSIEEAENRLFTKDHTCSFYPVLNSIIKTIKDYQNATQTIQHETLQGDAGEPAQHARCAD